MGLAIKLITCNELLSLKEQQQNMNRNWVTLWFLIECVGAIFYSVVAAAYFLPFPSTQILIGEPIFKTLLALFGGLFLVLTLVAMIVFKATKRT
jgi:predicted Abi (CAAX) family protease